MRIEADKIDVSRLLLPREFTRKGKREPGPFRLVYHGPLDETAIGSIVVAGAFLRERMDIEMTFVGTGQLAGPAAELIDTLPDPEIVTVVSTQDIEEVERLIESADAGIVLRYGRDWSPSPAIFDFMRCAIPVVAEMNAVTLDLLGDERGTIVPRGEPISLADAVYRLNAAGAIRRSIGLRGLRRIEHLSWRADREVLAGGAVKQGQP